MHLSTVHGSSYYSRSTDSVAKVSFSPLLNTLLRRDSEEVRDTSGDWKYWVLGALALIGLCVAPILWAYGCSARRKWKHGRRAEKQQQQQHAQWYGHQTFPLKR